MDALDRPTTHPLDRATALSYEGSVAHGVVTKDYWGFVGPFGGVTAGAIMRALLLQPQAQGDPVALTVNFGAAPAEGPYRIVSRLVRATRNTQHWSLEWLQGTDQDPLVTATAVLASRRQTWSHQPLAAPPAPAPATLASLSTEGKPTWIGRYDMRYVEGLPLIGAVELAQPAPSRSILWIRDVPDRALDFVSLAALSDAFIARIFQVRGTMRPFGTVSMTTYFHAAGDDLPQEPGAFLLGVADARRFHAGFGDQTVDLFAADGRLVATSHQTTFFRD
ncbi:acyl-CoA thioesterase [Zavarzinia sp. CC-PAN008]|uniref:acyl-CoA thioesterase n=1 Tax=Zavarzinia sp. CC-PAN008 TaxID=3243332 RepID=UPI003F748E70